MSTEPAAGHVAPFDEEERAGFRQAVAEFAKVSGLMFVEAPRRGMIQAQNVIGSDYGGFAGYPTVYGEEDRRILSTSLHIEKGGSYARGGDMFSTLLHEIGHAVGLKHPHEGRLQLRAGRDDADHTVMSYNGGNGPARRLPHLDVDATQSLYGAPNRKFRASYDPETERLEFRGGRGDDEVAGGNLANRMAGRGGDDRLHGASRDDILLGGAGDDALWGCGGADTLRGGRGADTLQGGNGADSLDGGAGDDVLAGGLLNPGLYERDKGDVLNGGAGNDTLQGGEGADTLDGGEGDDALNGGNDDDVLEGGAGDDLLEGGFGDDSLSGGAGDDTLRGGYDDDVLLGGDGADLLDGGRGDDALHGGAGDDELRADAGFDALFGDAGDDHLIFATDGVADGGAGADLIELVAGTVTVIFAPGAGADTVVGFDAFDLFDLRGRGDVNSAEAVAAAFEPFEDGVRLVLGDDALVLAGVHEAPDSYQLLV